MVEEQAAARGQAASVIDDIRRTLSSLTTGATGVANDVGVALHREIATAVDISERIRDEIVSRKLLAETRDSALLTDVRSTAHDIVDLAADVVGVVAQTAVRAVSRYADAMAGAAVEHPGKAGAEGKPHGGDA